MTMLELRYVNGGGQVLIHYSLLPFFYPLVVRLPIQFPVTECSSCAFLPLRRSSAGNFQKITTNGRRRRRKLGEEHGVIHVTCAWAWLFTEDARKYEEKHYCDYELSCVHSNFPNKGAPSLVASSAGAGSGDGVEGRANEQQPLIYHIFSFSLSDRSCHRLTSSVCIC